MPWIGRLALLCGAFLVGLSTSVQGADRSPLTIARQGWLFAGGQIDTANPDRPVLGQLYAEYQIPAHRTHLYPVVMIHGSLQSGANFTGTPDGREGWAQYFLRRGYAVYVVDQPGRGRAAYYERAYGPQTLPSLKKTEDQFVAPERASLWPQARLHTQWPGAGRPGDPAFDNFFASEMPSISDPLVSETLMRDAVAALLDRIGSAIILVHSQAGLYGWSIAQARPARVRGLIAIEPSGPPVHAVEHIGAPNWFKDSALEKPSGLGMLPLRYAPPLKDGEKLRFARAAAPRAPGMVRCWAQGEPARRLETLDQLPILMLTAQASYHASYDDCTSAYLRQAGAKHVEHIHLADIGILGNGHMMMLEKNSEAIAKVIVDWLDAQPWNLRAPVPARGIGKRYQHATARRSDRTPR